VDGGSGIYESDFVNATGTPVVGMVGAGQLARMTIEAATPLDVTVRVLAAASDESAALIARHVEVSPSLELDPIAAFAAGCDVVTFDHELVAPEVLRALEERGHVLRPGAAAELYAQDKLYQRRELAAGGFPVPAFRRVESLDDLTDFAAEHGWPVVAKAVRGGYDGRGVWVLSDAGSAAELWSGASGTGTPLLVEQFVPIERELAALVARRPSGEAVVYPVVETVQADGMCRELVVPCAVPAAVTTEASALALRLAEAIDATGIMAVELFLTREGLLVNELALRPHNSGHWTIEGAQTSQFENHLRAVLDWPLGATGLVSPVTVTVNVIGRQGGVEPREVLPRALAVPGVRVHLYGKGYRPGRKLGHVTALGDEVDETRTRAWRAAELLMSGEAR
jgi:5-(carboxyamino)imidazole ribonucleotide synthase